VILAAGMGSRIRAGGVDVPKPLVDVGGLPLLKRAILTATRADIKRFVVILGYEADLIKEALVDDEQLADYEIEWVTHERYDLKNGVSVLQAQPYISGEFYLTMADHVVEPAIYQALGAAPLRGDLALAVDYKLDDVFDMDDATKVKVGRDSEILEIDKALSDFDAVDTGVFRCSEGLFDALNSFYQTEGDASLSQGVKTLADTHRAHVVDVGAAWWQDVDDVSTRDEAERRLFASLTKASDGFVSRHFNRPVSKMISRRLLRTQATPNHVTAAALFIGLCSALANFCVTAETLWLFPLGGFLFHFSSVVDGCDGEIARLRFQFSEFGAWFDTISDVIINFAYLFSFGFAVTQVTGDTLWVGLSSISLLLGLVTVLTVSIVLRRQGDTYLPAMDWSFNDSNDRGSVFQVICRHFAFAARRDFYAFALMFLSFMGLGVAKGSVVMALVVISFAAGQNLRTQLKQRRLARPMTPVLLNTKNLALSEQEPQLTSFSEHAA
jgi:CDP-L-myo-inositol myo-inositolphosphotransferase